MPHVSANGVRLFAQRAGAGPDVVLVHAVTGNQAVWVFTGVAAAVAAAGFRVTTFDLRGHGASDRPAAGYTSADTAADLLGLCAALGLGPAVVVGHSFGGVTALHAAALDPSAVAGVVLSDSFFPGLRHVEPNFGRAGVWADLRDKFAAVGAELPDAVDFAGLFRAAAGLSPDRLSDLETLVGPAARGWVRQLPRLARTACGDEVLAEAGLTADRIANVHAPVVALYDEHSPFLATYRWLTANVPGCVGEVVPGARHFAVVESTEAFTGAVVRHLARLAGRG